MLVKISGWKEGFPKVEFNRHLRAYAGLSIGEAKEVVDTIMANKTVEIDFHNLSEDEMKRLLTKMKVSFEIVS